MTASNGNRRWYIPLLAYLILASISLAFLEGASRLALGHLEEISRVARIFSQGSGQQLDAYEVAAVDNPLHWRLKPGYEADVKTVVSQKMEQGKFLSVDALIEQGNLKNIPARGVLRVNSAGFKGPELATDKADTRVVTIGESTTFGFGPFDYPSAMRWEFSRQGKSVEVVNAGIEGYSTRNILIELDRIISIKPEIAVIYVGWNDLFMDDEAFCVPCRYSSFAKIVLNVLKRMQKVDSKTQNIAIADDPSFSRLDGYEPAAMENIHEIIQRLKAANVQPVLVTLAGLYLEGFEKRPKVGGFAPLPVFIDNPVYFAKMSAIFNRRLRLLAKRENIQLIDAEEWSREALNPRFEYFTDSVHMDARALSKMGIFIAQALIDDGLVF